MTTTADFLAQYRNGRRNGVSLIAVSTPDPAASIERMRNSGNALTPALVWDACRGWYPANTAGKEAIIETLDGVSVEDATIPLLQMLIEWAPKLPGANDERPGGSVLFLMNAHRYLDERGASGAAFVQAVWNLRDEFKRDLRTLVLMGPAITLPPELSGDVLVLDEPLPDDAEVQEIIERVVGEGEATCKDVPAAVAALRGLPAFSAEQATALAIVGDALDQEALWDRKRKMIAATPGLSVYQGGETLDDVGGCDAIKGYLRREMAGREPFRAVFFTDEIEKMMAGATGGAGDGGVSAGALYTHLTEMQAFLKTGSTGALLVGPPGAAKTMIAQTVGATAGVPTIVADYNAAKNSLVGKSEENMRAMFKTLWAVSAGRVLFVATCNKQVDLPPELKRRYTGGIWYFDLPTPDEQERIWTLKLAKYGLSAKAKRPNYTGWTGAEIETACRLAWRLNLPLTDVACYIVPVAKSAAEQIEALRQQADGKFLSASTPGHYTRSVVPSAPTAPRQRARAGAEV